MAVPRKKQKVMLKTSDGKQFVFGRSAAIAAMARVQRELSKFEEDVLSDQGFVEVSVSYRSDSPQFRRALECADDAANIGL